MVFAEKEFDGRRLTMIAHKHSATAILVQQWVWYPCWKKWSIINMVVFSRTSSRQADFGREDL